VPAQFQQPAGYSNLPRVQIKDHDKTTRNFVDLSLSHTLNAGGIHQFKGGFGYSRATNDVNLAYPNGGYVTVFWNSVYESNVPGIGAGTGTYGYYSIDNIGTQGVTGANILSLYVQDNWNIGSRLTLNLGVRTESEDIPSFRPDISPVAIHFGWRDKLAPRLGFAYNLSGDGRTKISGAYGRFFDWTKYELARGTFGGDVWTTRYRSLDDPDPTKLSLSALTGRNLWDNQPDSYKDSRIPSFGPDVVASSTRWARTRWSASTSSAPTCCAPSRTWARWSTAARRTSTATRARDSPGWPSPPARRRRSRCRRPSATTPRWSSRPTGASTTAGSRAPATC
jgi:hypothetical protein